MQSSQLQTLDLSGCEISDQGAIDLAKVMLNTPALSSLLLAGNLIGDTGCKALCAMLEKNCAVTKLWLQANQISTAGALALERTLEVNTVLCSLSLSGNPIPGVLNKRISMLIDKNASLASKKKASAASSLAGPVPVSPAISSTSNRSSTGAILGPPPDALPRRSFITKGAGLQVDIAPIESKQEADGLALSDHDLSSSSPVATSSVASIPVVGPVDGIQPPALVDLGAETSSVSSLPQISFTKF